MRTWKRDKKIFTPRKEIMSRKVFYPYETIKANVDFFPINQIELLRKQSKDKYLAEYLFPNPNISDQSLLASLTQIFTRTSKFITGKNIRVKINEIEGENSATFKGDEINISISSLFDHRVPFYARLNTIFHSAYHEMFHIKFTTPEISRMLINKGLVVEEIDRFGRKIKKPDFTKLDKIFTNSLHQTLSNITEDKRIETKGLQIYPGYVFYFDEGRRYGSFLHQNILKEEESKTSDHSNPEIYYSLLLKYITFKVLGPESLNVFLPFTPKDSEFRKLMKAVDEITKSTPVTFIEALNQADQLLKLFPKDVQSKIQAPTKLIEVKLTAEELEKLVEVLEEKGLLNSVKIENISYAEEGSSDKEVQIFMHPAEEAPFEPSIYNTANTISKTISKNLSFLDSRFNRSSEVFELNSGILDEDEIYSISFNKNVFFEEEPSPGYNLDFGILIDESGSMGGERIEQAKTAALALALALNNNQHINLFIYGHTADLSNEPVSMYCYIDSVQRINDLQKLFSIQSRSCNADGFAIAKMGEILKKGKARKKVLVVVSDGQPSARNYGGQSGIKHTAEMVKNLEKAGMFVIQISIGDGLNSKEMFQHYIPYSTEDLGKNLKKVLLKNLTELSNTI